ncbi:M20/M25/M40 family metallo-hydrolase [Novosphingobium sp.]|uniref:M20/M25/M40 family metallo-hydrolase n=1 Tax=Novosphingobium sp. TaxID=1874826 RepID=UPI0025E60551|nr:M20/M25/M40 family metallo-hydrolase [Novosphingobium sp.]
MKTIGSLLAATILAGSAHAATPAATPAPSSGEADFRALYKELIETNTTQSTGSCTLAAERMAARLKAAGFADSQITMFAVPEHPKDGGLVAILPGTDKRAKPILLLAHLDVVEAKRADWTRDPFTLIEENGYFYGRGTVDDKAQAAIWTDTMVRFAREKYKPKRTVKLALTCGEETSGAFNGAEWLAKNKRELIDAAFALNEGGGGRTTGKPISQGGKLEGQSIQVGEKAYQDFTLTVTNPGGHSSTPVRENAIYVLGDALARIRDFEFPVQVSDTTRAFFTTTGKLRGDAMGQAMVALAANPADTKSEAILNQDRTFHSMLRTTCVATMVDAGHALNALPQRATANVNCRMFPGRTSEETQAALVKAIDNPKVTVDLRVKDKPIAIPPPLDPAIVGPAQKLAARYFPGVPFVPTMLTGATDGVYLEAVGIPTYGAPGVWLDPDGNGLHGLNERVEVRSLLTGRDYLFDLVKAYAG